jgi:hypothetical protein
MTLEETLISVWRQVLVKRKLVVALEGETYSVGSTRAKRLRTVRFSYLTYKIDGIEQNPNTSSQWAALARDGKQVMQFSFEHRYIANVCEGKPTRYPAWFKLQLPE